MLLFVVAVTVVLTAFPALSVGVVVLLVKGVLVLGVVVVAVLVVVLLAVVGSYG